MRPGAVADRVKGAIYGSLIGDSTAMPTHWFYQGERQVRNTYGGSITGYVKPATRLPGSIMSKSNTGGAGRGLYQGNIIGDVIFHGKKEYWAPGQDFHYHATLEAGENTLEGLLLRRAMRVSTAAGGVFDGDAIVTDYVDFMTTPGSHNDTYCGTCHRMFFANRESGIALAECPDNDGHNVDTADSLVTTIPIALLSADDAAAQEEAGNMVYLTRKSKPSAQHAGVFATMLRAIVKGGAIRDVLDATARTALRLDLPRATGQRGTRDPVTA